MLATNTYPKAYLADCRAQIDAQLAAYKTLAAGTPKAVLVLFTPLFFNNLTLVIDLMFGDRARANEGKDGNVLNEVRMLASSILHDRRVLAGDKAIKYKADESVTKIAVGEPIALDEPRFRALAKAYFAEIEKRFT